MSTYYICVLDFEATCEKDSSYHEVIEFPSVLYKYDMNKNTFDYVSQFQEYVKPKNISQLSQFCIELTGITQDKVDNSKNFPTVLKNHYSWLTNILKNEYHDVIMLTCGDWDLKTMAPFEYELHKITDVPNIYLQYINIKFEFEKFFKVKRFSLLNMINYFNLEFVGRQHSGIDDCINTALVYKKMIENGYILNLNNIKKVILKN
jgi:inhibitor of KinA sporulation pathway (predicted exonuclease)